MFKKKPKVTPLKGRIDMSEIFQKFKENVTSDEYPIYNTLHDEDFFGKNV